MSEVSLFDRLGGSEGIDRLVMIFGQIIQVIQKLNKDTKQVTLLQ